MHSSGGRENQRLPFSARRVAKDDASATLVSAASAWEVATKHRLGKLDESGAIALDIAGAIAEQGFQELPISVEEAAQAGSLPGPLRDPFDRILIAQALSRGLVLVSNETVFDRYGVRRLW